MPRGCVVCAHPDVFTINERLVGIGGRLSLRNIAKQFDLNYQAINRHREHVPELLVKALESEEAAQADDLLAQVRDLHDRTLAILEASEQTRDHKTALAAIREARSNLELIGEITKELNRTPTLNLQLNPEYLEVRALIVQALEPYPDACYAVVRALEGKPMVEANGSH